MSRPHPKQQLPALITLASHGVLSGFLDIVTNCTGLNLDKYPEVRAESSNSCTKGQVLMVLAVLWLLSTRRTMFVDSVLAGAGSLVPLSRDR